MLTVKITNVNFTYVDGAIGRVEVHYEVKDSIHEMDHRGYLPLKLEEYSGNEGISSLINLIKQNVIDRFQSIE